MEEKQENISIRWPVKWANYSKKLSSTGWLLVLLTLILFGVGAVATELLPNMPRPSILEHILGIIFMILFYSTLLCFLSSFIAGITSLLAPFFTIVGYKEVKSHALRGISYSILYFFVFLVLMSPTILRRIKSAQSQCRWNQRRLCREMSEHPEVIAHEWCDALKKEIENTKLFRCNYDKIGPCSYSMNENIPADANELPRDLVLLFESAPGWNQAGGADDVVTDRHKRPGANIAFADGHVEFVEADNIPALRWTLENKSPERK